MADNKLIKNGTGAGTDFTAATDEIGGIDYPRVKMGHGVDGSYSDVSASAPMPVAPQGSGSAANGTQTAVSSSAVSVAASDSTRNVLWIQNITGGSVRIGMSSVTATTGAILRAGETAVIDQGADARSQWFAIRDGATDATILAMRMG